jgi:hypothetical protein|tara:strand:+ start:1337 stop:1567 length:231 start_codon:yes stop_codon:yes gene_type:complete
MRREEVVVSSKIDFITGLWERTIDGNKKVVSINNMTKLLKKDLLELAEMLLCNVDSSNTKQQIIEVIQNKINLDNQ